MKTIYPTRSGSHRWPEAFGGWTARLSEGKTEEELHAATERYGAYCRATGKVGTERVLQAASFFGPKNRFFEEPWDLPVGTVPSETTAASEAASEALQRAIHRGMTLAEVGCVDPIAMLVLRDCGGLRSFRDCQERELPFLLNKFKAAYITASQTSNQRSVA